MGVTQENFYCFTELGEKDILREFQLIKAKESGKVLMFFFFLQKSDLFQFSEKFIDQYKWNFFLFSSTSNFDNCLFNDSFEKWTWFQDVI